MWLLGYPEAALADAEQALRYAREIGQAATLMAALNITAATHIFCGSYPVAIAQSQELFALAEEKGALLWRSVRNIYHGVILALTGKASDAVQMITPGSLPTVPREPH